jgi:hypothetical protein
VVLRPVPHNDRSGRGAPIGYRSSSDRERIAVRAAPAFAPSPSLSCISSHSPGTQRDLDRWHKPGPLGFRSATRRPKGGDELADLTAAASHGRSVRHLVHALERLASPTGQRPRPRNRAWALPSGGPGMFAEDKPRLWLDGANDPGPRAGPGTAPARSRLVLLHRDRQFALEKSVGLSSRRAATRAACRAGCRSGGYFGEQVGAVSAGSPTPRPPSWSSA